MPVSIEIKEQIRQAVDIVDLVGRYVQLRRQGTGYVGLCPWHDDKKPSLQVDPRRQSFKCWVCDIGGDAFTFVMKREGVEFPEALEILADRAGVVLTRGASQPAKAGEPGDRRTLFKAMAWAEEQFHRCLVDSPQADVARGYLAERGVSDSSIARFHIGFSPPEWDWILQRGARAPAQVGGPFSPAVLERIGLVKAREIGSGYYDRFRGRVLFPIRDVQARPIALGGRIIPGQDETGAGKDPPPKYINSPETPLFSKSDQLYALDLARDAISQHGFTIVVEGYTDCVIAHQCGVENVVAVLGTALGERHVRLLARFSDSVTLVLDGDEAGQRRTNEVLELFVAQRADLRILALPESLDPCDFLRTHGSEAFSTLVEKAEDALQYKIRMVTKGLAASADPHLANQALEEILRTLARAPRLSRDADSALRLREDQLLVGLARQFRVAEEQLRERLASLRRGAGWSTTTEQAAARRSDSFAGLDFWDRELLELAVAHPQTLPQLLQVVPVEQLRSPLARAIYATCRRLAAVGAPVSFSRLTLELDDPQAKNLLVRLEDLCESRPAAELDSRILEVIASFQRRKEDLQTQDDHAALQQGQLDDEQEISMLDGLLARLRNRQTGAPPTEGRGV
jgi:DNA primase